MRLREVVDSSTGARELKLCKKYSSDDPFSGPIVNVYLSEAECDVLRALPARLLTKRRYQLVHRGLQFGLDVFEGELAGLVLCEVEAESRKAVLAISAPPWAGREVTTDTFFTGGRLSGVNAADLAAKVGAMRSF